MSDAEFQSGLESCNCPALLAAQGAFWQAVSLPLPQMGNSARSRSNRRLHQQQQIGSRGMSWVRSRRARDGGRGGGSSSTGSLACLLACFLAGPNRAIYQHSFTHNHLNICAADLTGKPGLFFLVSLYPNKMPVILENAALWLLVA